MLDLASAVGGAIYTERVGQMHWSAEVVAEVSRSLRETSEARVTSNVRSHPSQAFAARRLAHLGQPGSSDGGGPSQGVSPTQVSFSPMV